MISARSWTVIGLVLAAAFSRLFPHPHNFAPIAALAVFSGACFSSRRWAPFVALGSLFLSDVLLQLTYQAGWQNAWGFYSGQWVVYLCTLASVGFGLLIRRDRKIATIAGATIGGSIAFFLVTNFAFVYGAESIYPRTLQGVMISYEAGLPFFRNSLLGDLFYSAVLFGAFGMAEAKIPALQSARRASMAA